MADKSLSHEIQGVWHQFVGEMKQEFSRLTEDGDTAVDGRREALIGKIQEKYGVSYDEAAQALSTFVNEHYTHEPGVEPVSSIKI